MSEQACIGFGEREGRCSNVAGTPWTPLWCDECDQERRDHITKQMQGIVDSFGEQTTALTDGQEA